MFNRGDLVVFTQRNPYNKQAIGTVWSTYKDSVTVNWEGMGSYSYCFDLLKHITYKNNSLVRLVKSTRIESGKLVATSKGKAC